MELPHEHFPSFIHKKGKEPESSHDAPVFPSEWDEMEDFPRK